MEVPLLTYAAYVGLGTPIVCGVLKGLTDWVFRVDEKFNKRNRYG